MVISRLKNTTGMQHCKMYKVGLSFVFASVFIDKFCMHVVNKRLLFCCNPQCSLGRVIVLNTEVLF